MTANWLRSLHGLMAGIFALCVLVQWNDPDALLWMLAYGLALVVCALSAFGRPPRILAGLLITGCLLWALWLLPQVAGKVSILDLFDRMDMKTREIELGRELGGLVIILVWMAVTLLTDKRQPRIHGSRDHG